MYYYIMEAKSGDGIFEGTLEQADNTFGLNINPTEEMLVNFVKSQGWWLFKRIVE